MALYDDDAQPRLTIDSLISPLPSLHISTDSGLIPKNRNSQGVILLNLGIGHYYQYERTRIPGDLECAIQQLQEALILISEDDPYHRILGLHELGSAYNLRYAETKATGDFTHAIQRLREALVLIPENCFGARALVHLVLGSAYRQHYTHFGDLKDLEYAIQRYQEAFRLVPGDSPSLRAGILEHLGRAYLVRHLGTGAVTDLEVGIEKLQEALDGLPENDSSSEVTIVHSLGEAYYYRYMKDGVMEDLENAVQRLQEALKLVPEGNFHYRRVVLVSLGKIYTFRYRRTNAFSDVEDAIRTHEEALSLTPENHPFQKSILRGIGSAYLNCYERTGALKHLANAIQRFEDILSPIPEDNFEWIFVLETLGAAYVYRYRRTGAHEDFENAIKRSREALNLRTEGHLDRAISHQILGYTYAFRHKWEGALEDLASAIRHFHKAVIFTPEDHPGRTNRLRNLGDVYIDCFERTRNFLYFKKAFVAYEAAFSHVSSAPSDRLRSGRAIFSIWTLVQDWSQAYKAATSMISLIPLLTLRSLEHSDTQHLVNQIVGLASDMASVALKAGKSPYDAIRFLETSRGIVASSLNDLRTDTTDLRNEYPHLESQFTSLRTLLDTPKESRKGGSRYDIAKSLDELLHVIRGLPGFEDFLLIPSEDKLKAAAIDGPIVIVNVSEYGCYALIIEEIGLRTLELPLLQIEDVQARAEGLENSGLEMLEWLWDKVASPILDALNFTKLIGTGDTWPRIWWIPTGPLTRFPIHAAGYYDGTYDTVMDRAISSYSSSIRAIVNSRRHVLTNSSSSKSMVLVGMAETPGHGPLPFASTEVEALANLCPLMNLQAEKPLACRKDILSAIKSCKIFHIASHGDSVSLDPSQSALILDDGRLTIGDLFDTNLHHKPFLAYLSACGTGQVKNDGLLDEGLHLIGACQLAGFQHVIGTLWKVNDKSCLDIARETYKWMTEQELSNNSVSEGLHHACRQIRGKWAEEANMRRTLRSHIESNKRLGIESNTEHSQTARSKSRKHRDAGIIDDSPLYWAPYVHFGA